MKKIARLAVVALLAACSAVTGVHAQEKPSDSESFRLGIPPYQVWSGRVRQADGKWTNVIPTKEYAQQMRKELASIQVSIDVDRKFDEARAKLDELAVRATLRGYDDRAAVLVEVALARVALLQKLGDSKAALEVTKSMLLAGNLAESSPTLEFANANDSDTKLDTTAVQDARLASLREKLQPNRNLKLQGPTNDVIDNLIAQGLDGNQDVIRLLGARAAPALGRRILAEGLDRLLDEKRDPLYILMDIDRRFAGEFVLSNFDKGGDIWKTRVLHCLESIGPFSADLSDWTYDTKDPYNPPKLDSPWMPVIERLLEDEALMPEVAFIAAHIAFGDALTPRLQKAYTNYLLGPNPAYARAVADCFPNIVGRSTTTPILEAGLSSTSATIRAASAQWLLMLPRSDALLASAKSADPVLRSAVASALQPRRVMRIYHKAREQPRIDTSDFVPAIDAPERALLVQLATDTEASVRLEAAKALVALKTPVEAEVYERLAADPDRKVRTTMLAATTLSTEAILKLGGEFAADADPLLLDKLDWLLFRAIVGKGPQVPSEFDPRFLPTLEARYANKARPFELTNRKGSLFSVMASSSAGIKALLQLSRLDDPMGPTKGAGIPTELAEFIATRVKKGDHRRGLYDSAAVGLALDGDAWTRLLMLQTTGEHAAGYNLTAVLVTLKDDYSSAFFSLAEDEHQGARLRLQALDVAAPRDSKRTLGILSKLLGALSSERGFQVITQDHNAVVSIGCTLKDRACSAALVGVVNDSSLADWAVNGLLSGVASDEEVGGGTLSDELTDALLARWRSSKTPAVLNAVGFALENIARRPRTKQGDWLILAAQRRDTFEQALRLMGDLRDPTYLDVLTSSLNGKGVPHDSATYLALETLTRYLNDDVAEIILKATGTAWSAEFRKKCFEALDQIRKYQEEKSRWEGRKTSQQAKDEAVRELVKLLDDGDAAVRAQAARSIATLGAVDQLPKLVTLLKDKDAGVRKAAQEALDALNAATIKKD